MSQMLPLGQMVCHAIQLSLGSVGRIGLVQLVDGIRHPVYRVTNTSVLGEC